MMLKVLLTAALALAVPGLAQAATVIDANGNVIEIPNSGSSSSAAQSLATAISDLLQRPQSSQYPEGSTFTGRLTPDAFSAFDQMSISYQSPFSGPSSCIIGNPSCGSSGNNPPLVLSKTFASADSFNNFLEISGGSFFAIYGDSPVIALNSDGSIFVRSQTANDAALFSQIIDVGSATPAVPEPATWLTLLVGVGGVGGTLRCRRKRASSVSYAA